MNIEIAGSFHLHLCVHQNSDQARHKASGENSPFCAPALQLKMRRNDRLSDFFRGTKGYRSFYSSVVDRWGNKARRRNLIVVQLLCCSFSARLKMELRGANCIVFFLNNGGLGRFSLVSKTWIQYGATIMCYRLGDLLNQFFGCLLHVLRHVV